MKFLALFSILVAGAAATVAPAQPVLDATYDFDKYIAEFNKPYRHNSAEYKQRKSIFDATLAEIKEHNAKGLGWTMGVNHLTDMSDSEFGTMHGYRRDFNAGVPNLKQFQSTPSPTLGSEEWAERIDWREKNAVTPVKDQGRCGSCWAFSSTESIESRWAQKTGHLVELSDQQIASCTANPLKCGGTGGCEGGTAEVAFASVISNGGIASEWTYPYISHNGRDHSCVYNSSETPAVAKIKSYVTLPFNEYEPLMTAINEGPLSISVDASSWKSYNGGIFDGCEQEHPVINHAVQLVGYGTEDGKDYWLVRNSWTPTWGEGGYIRILRQGKDATCGTDLETADGVWCAPYPKSKKVCGTCGILSDSAYPVV